MLLLIGASASGKTETAKYLMEHFNIKKIITCTTRAPRANEVNDVDYHFLSVEEFQRRKDAGLFLERLRLYLSQGRILLTNSTINTNDIFSFLIDDCIYS